MLLDAASNRDRSSSIIHRSAEDGSLCIYACSLAGSTTYPTRAAFFTEWRVSYQLCYSTVPYPLTLRAIKGCVPRRIYPYQYPSACDCQAPRFHLRSQGLGTFHIALEQTFAFYKCVAGLEPTTHRCEICCSTSELGANLPRRATP